MRGMMRLGVILGVVLLTGETRAIDPPSSAVPRIEFMLTGLSVVGVLDSCTVGPQEPTTACGVTGNSEFQHTGWKSTDIIQDVLGNLYTDVQSTSPVDCGASGTPSDMGVGRTSPSNEFEMVIVVPAGCEDGISTWVSGVNFQLDLVSGTAYLHVSTRFKDGSLLSDWRRERILITGFPTLFDVVATFEPSGPNLSWNVPPMPEAFPGPVDGFDVLVGDLRSLPSFGQASPIACGIPGNMPPEPGDTLSVTDPLQDPMPGTGRYYLVTSRRGQEERLGRQRLAGELSGRPASGQSGCP